MEYPGSIINYHLFEIREMEHFSERTFNVCLEESLDSLFKIIAFYYKHGNFMMIKNCGEKTNNELVDIAQKYLIKYNLTPAALSRNNEENNLFEKFKFFCFENFNISSLAMEEYKKDFNAGKFQFFKFIMLAFKTMFTERDFFILESNCGFFKVKKKYTLQAIGDKFEITYERVRQISKKIPVEIEATMMRFLKEIDYIQNHFDYNLNFNNDYCLINSFTADFINLNEKLNFTPKFYAFIFSLVKKDTHQLVQKGCKNDKNFYLIENELASAFNFCNFYENICALTHNRNDQTYQLNLNDYLQNFLNTSDLTLLNPISTICKDIIINEFKLKETDDKIFIIQRNTPKRLSEYIIEILNDKGRPLHLNEIRKELNRRTVKRPPNIESLRSSILSIKKIKAIGKTSTYALKGWSYIQTATIRKLVFDFLLKYDEPKNILEITNYIKQFRKTNDKNILANLKLDKNQTFQFFKSGYVGLCSKKYNVYSNS